MPDRPLLMLPTPERIAPPSQNRNFPRLGIRIPDKAQQVARIGPVFQRLRPLVADTPSRVLELRDDPTSLAPERVIVFEIAGTVQNFAAAIRKVPGLDLLAEQEIDRLPDEHFANIDARVGHKGQDRTDTEVNGRFYLAMPDISALRELLRLWQRWASGQALGYGYGPFSSVFAQLRDLRPWGPLDRIPADTITYWREETARNPGQIVRTEVELWFHSDASRSLEGLARDSGGSLVHQVTISEISYHGALLDLPAGEIAGLMARHSVRLALADVRGLILTARERVALYVNQETSLLYWDIGARIRRDVLDFERAAYGQRIMQALGNELTREFGRGYSWRNLFNMVAFAATFPDREILQTLSAKLSWSHFVELLRVEDPLARSFYTELARLHHWGVRALRDKIRSRLYDRSLLSRKPEELIEQELALLRDEDRLTVDMVLRDPYLLAGLGLGERYSEQELEDAILREMEAFLLEIGDGFAFVARQKRFPSPESGGKVRELDLLFYHRKLRRLVAIELKIGAFEPEFKGQMDYYLRWLDQNERETGEERPIGLILRSEAHPDDISLMGLDQGDIRVARYITENLPPPLLEKKLREIVARHREFQARRAVQNALAPPDEANTDP